MVPGIRGSGAHGVTKGVTGSIFSKFVNLKIPAIGVILITKTNTANNMRHKML